MINKITETEISKLKQLDRIEYRQKLRDLNEKYKPINITDFFYQAILPLLMFIFLFDIYLKVHGIMTDLALRIIPTFLIGSISICVIFLVINILIWLVHIKNYNKLNGQYFKLETK